MVGLIAPLFIAAILLLMARIAIDKVLQRKAPSSSTVDAEDYAFDEYYSTGGPSYSWTWYDEFGNPIDRPRS